MLVVITGLYYYSDQDLECGCNPDSPVHRRDDMSSADVFSAEVLPDPWFPRRGASTDASTCTTRRGASETKQCVVFASTTMDAGLIMGHLAVVLAYLHAILLFWRDSKHIEPERVEEVLEELGKARLVTDEEPCDGETLERTINAELEKNLVCPQGFKYFDKIRKFSDIAKMPEEPEHLLQKKRIELVKASAVVQSLSAE